MEKNTIVLNEEFSVTLTPYLNAESGVHDAMLVVPGGGYGCVCSDREGGPIADAFVAEGYSAFVLEYRVAPAHRYPAQLIDIASAVYYLRTHAAEYGINPERIFTVGFSAGGHLVGTLATKHKEAEKLLGLPENSTRPTGTVYCYPVVGTDYPTHGGSFTSLTGLPFDEIPADTRHALSIDENITASTPPAFIWHTAEDDAVPACGSLALCRAYMDAGVPVSLRIYPYGPHGVALGNEVTHFGNGSWLQPLATGWVKDASDFLKTVK
ncbi:MAG: alpha/beta hydrolase [Clostridia bacterium]|nr:alpha/beta hydrolase [Clostridia bacterium]